MDDLISRQNAIDALDQIGSLDTDADREYARSVFESLPSAQPEQKTGKWIPLQLSMPHPPYQCSCCFRNAPMVETGCLLNRHLEALLTDFCPHCGADMRGEQDG